MRTGIFEIRRAMSNQWYFVLKAANGRIIATSETYKTRAGVSNGINSVMNHAPSARIVEREQTEE